jgi:shikimate kinase
LEKLKVPKSPIALVGYMGSGKSKYGRKLAAQFEVPFIDLDHQIAEAAGMTISEFMSVKGELAFRKLEQSTLHQVLDQIQDQPAVLSVGGGTPCYYDNMERIRANCLTVYLFGSAGLLAARLADNRDHRPLLAHLSASDLPEFVAKHLFERQYFYGMAHLHVPIQKINIKLLIKQIHAYEQARDTQ